MNKNTQYYKPKYQEINSENYLFPDITLLSKQYVNNKAPLLWKCKKEDHEFPRTINSINSGAIECPECQKVSKRTEKEIIIENLSKYNFTLINQYYDKYTLTIDIKCKNNHTLTKQYHTFLLHPTCNECKTQDKIEKTLKAIKNKLPRYKVTEALNNNYNTKIPIKMLCSRNHPIKMTFNQINSLNLTCKYCNYKNTPSIEWLQYFFDTNTDIRVNNYQAIRIIKSNGSIKTKCNKGHSFSKTWKQLDENPYCKECDRIDKRTQNVTSKIKQESNCEVLNNIITSAKDKILIRCLHGHIEWSGQDVLNRTYQCSKCSPITSIGEDKCKKIFETIFKVEFKTVRPDFLKNPETGYNLELDGYNKELKLAFEYDGTQHYKLKFNMNSDDLSKTQKRDKLKDKLCKENNITLIRIPYWENKNLEEFIKSELKENYGQTK